MTETAPPAGQMQQMEEGLCRVLAPNPSPMTHWGTNTYLLGRDGPLAVIDPGPDDARHLAALMAAIGERRVSHIIVTHSHLDHSALARPLAQATGAPVLGFGSATAGRSAAMQALVEAGLSSGGEGIDTGFVPDIHVAEGQVLQAGDWALEVIHTPGHLGNHICLDWQGRLFTGDHVMGWASSLVSPPDGDLTEFMASCAKLGQRAAQRYYPGHGAPIDAPAERLRWLIDHRRSREAQIIAALRATPEPIGLTGLTRQVYTDTPPALLPAAARNVLAHLVDLVGKNQVTATLPLSDTSHFSTPRDPGQ